MLPKESWGVSWWRSGNLTQSKDKFSILKTALRLLAIASITGLNLLRVNSIKAQVTSDNTLGTQVNTTDNVAEISGGRTAGNNLFHSFQDFSLATGNTAFFNNAANIDNIVSRVTGGNISNIDGLIRANGDANLILVNPSGVNFGANASLDLGGSFLGSTADSVIFDDGTVFSATGNPIEPTLTISAPVGLQLGQNPAAINITGRGSNLSSEIPVFSPFIIGETSGLEVQPGQTLALVGGEIGLTGATLTAPTGRIELGSVEAGIVRINSLPQGWSLDYEGITNLQDITLSQAALIDTSGVRGGSIRVQGQKVTLQDGSSVIIQNQGEQESGNLVVNAAESLEIKGTSADEEISTSLLTAASSSGRGGEIRITTPQLKVLDGGLIFSRTFGNATAGQVNINTTELEVSGFSAAPIRFSAVTSQTLGSGTAGDINISTSGLTALDGGNIASISTGETTTGSAGQINIDATESVELIGVPQEVLTPSAITAFTGSAGNAGTININTQRLFISDGAQVDASTRAVGNAGNIEINATNSIKISGTGTASDSLNPSPSSILAAADALSPTLQELFQLPAIPKGNAGNIEIKTSQLNISDRGEINTSTAGVGNSGNIRINADSILLDSLAAISSEAGIIPDMFGGAGGSSFQATGFVNNFDLESFQNTENIGRGEINISTQTLSVAGGASIVTNTFTNFFGGNITIDATESIRVQGFSIVNPNMLSVISTASFGSGDAGNLSISTGRLTILDGSRVAAGAFANGSGGNIDVKAELIEVVGIEPSQSAASLLGASSLGVGNAGNLTIDTSRLVVEDGGRVDSSAAATGSAGDVTIKASESIEISGTIPGNNDPSLISSGANVEDELAQQIFRLPSAPSGNAGNVNIETGRLQVSDRANVSVVNEGLGNAGTLAINADLISLEDRGSLSAATQTGEGGNINLRADNVFLQSNSTATATAAGAEDGGNITVDAQNLAVLGNSRVTANAFRGRGGNIQFDSQGFFTCQQCQVTASSRLGIDGLIRIETLQPDSQLEILNMPQKPTEVQEAVAIACPAQKPNNISKLSLKGRGGLPPRPQDALIGESLINSRSQTAAQTRNTNSITTKAKLPAPARGWYTNSQGIVVLSAQVQNSEVNPQDFNGASCRVR